jgi:tetratricopeptide (TPR) repeat protein
MKYTKRHILVLSALVIIFSLTAFFVFTQFRFSVDVATKLVPLGLSSAYNDIEDAEYRFNGTYNLQKARTHYSNLIREDERGNERAWYQLGKIDFIEGHFDAAIYRFNQQRAHFGNTLPQVHYMLGLSYGYKALSTKSDADWQKAEKSFRKFMEFAPSSPWPRVDLAWVYFSQGKYDEMVPILEKGLEHEPQNAWLLNAYGLALLNIGDKVAAKRQFEKAKTAASELTVRDWGNAYKENDPSTWKNNLHKFERVIENNLQISD